MSNTKSLISNLIKVMGNDCAAVAADGIVAGDVANWIDTGSYSLNAVLSGSIYRGLPSNKITAFAGESATGKTFFVLSIVKHFLEQNPDAVVIYFESESALTKEMLQQRKLDVNRIIIVPVATVEEFKAQALRMVNSYLDLSPEDRPVMMFCLDSLGMLSTNKEMADSHEGKDVRDMTRSQVIKAAFRVLTLKLGKANIPLLIANHVYDVIGSPHGGKETSGGSGPKYAASTTITLTKAKARGEDIGGGSTDREVVGSVISCTAVKSRLTIEGSKIKTLLTHKHGLSRYYGLFDLAERAGVFVKNGRRYQILDWHDAVWKKDILARPETYYTTEVLDKIDEWVQANFMYGASTDEDVSAFFDQLGEGGECTEMCDE